MILPLSGSRARRECLVDQSDKAVSAVKCTDHPDSHSHVGDRCPVAQQANEFTRNPRRGELIIGKLTPQGFDEISRAKLLAPTLDQLNQRNGVCWSHPAFANRHVVARNDQELVRANLAAE